MERERKTPPPSHTHQTAFKTAEHRHSEQQRKTQTQGKRRTLFYIVKYTDDREKKIKKISPLQTNKQKRGVKEADYSTSCNRAKMKTHKMTTTTKPPQGRAEGRKDDAAASRRPSILPSSHALWCFPTETVEALKTNETVETARQNKKKETRIK
jgi:hypothetical protein